MLRGTLFLQLPFSIALAMAAPAVVALLFGHGGFDEAAQAETALVTSAYSITAIFLMLWRHARPYLSALWHGRAWAGAVLMGIGFTVAYKLLDGIARKLAPLGIEISADAERTAFVVEEIGELGIPVMFLAAILLWPGPSLTTAHPTNRAHRV